MSNLKDDFKKAVTNPALIPKAIYYRLKGMYALYSLRKNDAYTATDENKDEFTLTVDRWFRDKGDSTLRLDYPLSSESIVFDLGGYKGDFAFEINQKYGCYVFVYEPVKKFYLECVERFKHNEKIKCFNYGISDQNGSFLIGDNNDGSSIIRDNTSVNSEEIIVKSFFEEFKSLGLSHIDLLKINVEGPEFLILPHIISNNIVQQIDNIQVQFHDFYPNAVALREEIRKDLSTTHTEKWNYPFVWESWSKNITST